MRLLLNGLKLLGFAADGLDALHLFGFHAQFDGLGAALASTIDVCAAHGLGTVLLVSLWSR